MTKHISTKSFTDGLCAIQILLLSSLNEITVTLP